MQYKIEDLLLNIDSVLESMHEDVPGLYYGLGGYSLYLSNRYSQSGNIAYHNRSIEVLEKIISGANQIPISGDLKLSYPGVAVGWLIDQYVRQGLLDSQEKENTKGIVDLLQSLTEESDLTLNYHDLFFGFIGKALVVLENDPLGNLDYVKKIVDALKKNAIHDKKGAYWRTRYPFWPSEECEETINLGIPHGVLGIILFLIKCHEIYKEELKLNSIITDSIRWLISQLDIEHNKLPYAYYKGPKGSGNLGWCYGDLSIAFTLLRYDETFHHYQSRERAYELIAQASSKSISQSGVRYFPNYGVFDIGLCHGTSSVAYMYKRMSDITGDQDIYKHAEKWLGLTIESLNTLLPQLNIIRNDKDTEINTTMGFLEGLSGVGLVLISFLDPSLSDWDKLLLLDRPGRDLSLNSPVTQSENNYAGD